MAPTPPLYPLLLEPALVARVWGGQRLESRLGKELPPDQPVGESWEIFWKNRILNGPLQGATLGDVIAQFPGAMTGTDGSGPEFPLLVKFIDAQDWLSVQVHPDDERAAALEGEPRGKTECWYVIDSAPGAQLAYGLAVQLDAESFRRAIQEGRAQDVIQYVSVAPGDFVFVPAGMLHAIGPGLLLYELQQTSDTTYRVYDWNRMGLDGRPRELHLDKALACTRFEVNPTARVEFATRTLPDGNVVASPIRSKYFALDKLTLLADMRMDTRGTAHLLSAVAGHVEVRLESSGPILLPQGQSAFVPAGAGMYQLIPDGDAEILCAWAV